MKTLLGCEWVETVAKVACLFFYTQGPWNHQIWPHLFQSDKVCAFHLSFSVYFPKLIAQGLEWMWLRLYLFVWGKISPGNSSMGLFVFEWNLQIVFQVLFPPPSSPVFCWSLTFLFPPYVITISIENSDSHHIFPPKKNHPDLPKGGHFWGDSTRRGKFVGRLTAPPRWFGMGWWLIVTYWYIISYNVHRHVDTPYISLCHA